MDRGIWQKIVIFSLISGCNGPLSFNPFARSDASAKQDDGRRPTEQGEGVIGYLRSPKDVSISKRGSRTFFNGTSGSVVSASGEAISDTPICLFQFSSDNLSEKFRQVKPLSASKALASDLTAEDGSFSLVVENSLIDINKYQVVDVSGNCGQSEATPITEMTDSIAILVDGGLQDSTFYSPSALGYAKNSKRIPPPTPDKEDFEPPDPEPVTENIHPLANAELLGEYSIQVFPKFVDDKTGEPLGDVVLYFESVCVSGENCIVNEPLGDFYFTQNKGFFVRQLETKVKVAPVRVGKFPFTIEFRVAEDWQKTYQGGSAQ